MAKIKPSYDPIEDLKGSSQHHDLKNQPGEKADKDHQKSDADPSDELKHAVADTNSDTGIADALREAVDDDEDDSGEGTA